MSQNAVFESFANQDANLREFLRELPTALQTTNKALHPVDRADGPARPRAAQAAPGCAGARAGPACAAAVRAPDDPADQEPDPPVRARGAADGQGAEAGAAGLREGHAQAGHHLRRPERAVQRARLQPEGHGQEGYLFWAYWLNHIGASVYTTQDAHGLIRRGIIFTDCIALGALEATRKLDAQLGTLIDLSNFADQAGGLRE